MQEPPAQPHVQFTNTMKEQLKSCQSPGSSPRRKSAAHSCFLLESSNRQQDFHFPSHSNHVASWTLMGVFATSSDCTSKLWPPQPQTWAAVAAPWTEIILKDSSESLPLSRVIQGSLVAACCCQSPPGLGMLSLKVQAISEKRNWKEKLNLIFKKQTTKPTTKDRQVFL